MPDYLIKALVIVGFLGVLCTFGWLLKSFISLVHKNWSTLKSWPQFLITTSALFALFCAFELLEKFSKHFGSITIV